MEFHCPKCGEESTVEVICLAPSHVTVTCPNCGAKWAIEIEFYENE